jgi:arginine metabolism regulation protein II
VLPKFGIANNPHLDDVNQAATMAAPNNDIHFAKQTYTEDMLYSSIYGIPESLMSLLSRIVACANEKDRAQASGDTAALQQHLQALESEMWSWDVPAGFQGPQPTLDTVDLKLSRAMHEAVIIYFYRRVYDTDAMILQGHVRKCLDCLEPCIGQKSGDQDFATSIAWATYIAACGAVTPELRQRALLCLDMIDRRGVMLTPKPAAQISRFWQRRLERGLFSPAEQGIPVGTAA